MRDCRVSPADFSGGGGRPAGMMSMQAPAMPPPPPEPVDEAEAERRRKRAARFGDDKPKAGGGDKAAAAAAPAKKMVGLVSLSSASSGRSVLDRPLGGGGARPKKKQPDLVGMVAVGIESAYGSDQKDAASAGHVRSPWERERGGGVHCLCTLRQNQDLLLLCHSSCSAPAEIKSLTALDDATDQRSQPRTEDPKRRETPGMPPPRDPPRDSNRRDGPGMPPPRDPPRDATREGPGMPPPRDPPPRDAPRRERDGPGMPPPRDPPPRDAHRRDGDSRGMPPPRDQPRDANRRESPGMPPPRDPPRNAHRDGDPPRNAHRDGPRHDEPRREVIDAGQP